MIRLSTVLTVVLLLSGCGEAGPATTPVKGKVTIGQGPLPGGSIQFILVSDPKLTGSGQISGDGSYQVTQAPIGECKVVIDNSHLKLSGATTSAAGNKMNKMPEGVTIPAGMGTGTSTKYVPIEAVYASADATPLKATVTRDGPAVDLEVK